MYPAHTDTHALVTEATVWMNRLPVPGVKQLPN